MTDTNFKRNIAYKVRIGDLLISKPIFDGDKFLFLELGNKKLSRVNIVGNVIDKYDSEGDKKYIFFTIDDGSGQIKLKSFGDDSEKFKTINQGDTIAIIGTTRHWNNEAYIQPETIHPMDPKYLLIRKLELEKEKKQNTISPEVIKETGAIKDQLLDFIKKSEEEGGIDTDQIIMKFKETSPNTIKEEIKKLLEEGIIFEPRPGRLRYLG